MFQRTLTFLVACLLTTSALAGEGVLFNYALTEESSSSDVTTSEFGFLMDFYLESGDLVHIGKRNIEAPFRETRIVKWGSYGEIEYTLSLKPTRHATPPAQDS